MPVDSLLEPTTHDGDGDGDGDSALRGNQCGQQYEHEVSAIREFIPISKSKVERGTKRKQSLRSLFGDGFLDNIGETSETETQAVLSVRRNEAEPLPDRNAMGLPDDDDTQGGQEGAIECGCNGIDVCDTQEGSQVGQEKEQSKLLIDDGMSSCHADKITPKDGNEQSKLSVDFTRTCKDRTKRRFDGDGIQSSLPSIGCNGIIIPDTEENSPGEETCHGNPAMNDKEQEETVAADGFVAIKRKDKPEQTFNTNKIPKPPTRREKSATLQENRGIVEQKVIVQERSIRSPLADMTNVSEVADAPTATEIRGKWKCPRKGKPYVGPPLKQLRLGQWLRRLV